MPGLGSVRVSDERLGAAGAWSVVLGGVPVCLSSCRRVFPARERGKVEKEVSSPHIC